MKGNAVKFCFWRKWFQRWSGMTSVGTKKIKISSDQAALVVSKHWDIYLEVNDFDQDKVVKKSHVAMLSLLEMIRYFKKSEPDVSEYELNWGEAFHYYDYKLRLAKFDNAEETAYKLAFAEAWNDLQVLLKYC